MDPARTRIRLRALGALRLPKRRDERLALGMLALCVLGAGLVLFDEGQAYGQGPESGFGSSVVALGPLFAQGARAPGSPLTLREIYQHARVVWRDAARGAGARLARRDELHAALVTAAGRCQRVDLLELRRIVAIESGANLSVGVNRSGYAGLFQMGPAACADVGTTWEEVKNDWRKNVEYGARFVELVHQRLGDAIARRPALRGVEIDSFVLYLGHQQGVQGAVALLEQVRQGGRAPVSPNQRNNLLPLLRVLGEHVPTELEYFVYVLGAFDEVAAAVR